jgi:Iron only hydrogenase large subunit, C-terminal domain
MPCLAKKYECQRDEFKSNGDPDVNYVLTTRELARLIQLANIDFMALPDGEFDSPMGESTGAGVISAQPVVSLRRLCERHTSFKREKRWKRSILNNCAGWRGFAMLPSILTGFRFTLVLRMDWEMPADC